MLRSTEGSLVTPQGQVHHSILLDRQTRGRGKTPTTTIKFVCLSNMSASQPPSSLAEKAALANSGLGPGSVTFQANGDLNYFHQMLMHKFPALSTGGAYELLLHRRGGLQHDFHKISLPYTPARVKEVAAQSQVYIRPLQKNLDTTPNDMAFPEEVTGYTLRVGIRFKNFVFAQIPNRVIIIRLIIIMIIIIIILILIIIRTIAMRII